MFGCRGEEYSQRVLYDPISKECLLHRRYLISFELPDKWWEGEKESVEQIIETVKNLRAYVDLKKEAPKLI